MQLEARAHLEALNIASAEAWHREAQRYGGYCEHCGALAGSYVIRRQGEPTDYCELAMHPEAPALQRWRAEVRRHWPEVAAELSLWTRPAPVRLQNRQLPDGDRATLCDPCSDHLRGRLLHTLDNDVPDRHQLALFGGDS